MSAFANLPISRKLMAAFAAVVAVIFVSSAIVYDRLRVIEDAKNSRVHTTDVLAVLQDSKDAMFNQETGVRGYAFTPDQTFLDRYHRGRDAFTTALQKLNHLTADNPAQQRRLDELGALASAWRSEIAERRIALVAKLETRDQAINVDEARVNRAAVDRILAKADEIIEAERELLAQRSAVESQVYTTAYAATILGGTIALITAIMMGALLTRVITVPISRMTNAMEALAKGDTGIEVPEAGRGDEIGAMAAAAKVFRDSVIERQQAQAELAHVNRLATMGQLTASIAHEINQPMAAIATTADATLLFLDARQPDLDEVRQAVQQIAEDSKRAGNTLTQIRALFKKSPPRKDRFDLNQAILEVIALVRSEVSRHRVSLQTQLAPSLPRVAGERTQLQQVVLNLILNAVEAMSGLEKGARELQIRTELDARGDVLVGVQDSGPGLEPTNADHVFDAFYTTKSDGMGMGLAICRSIIVAHRGRMWAVANQPRGALFQFTIPAA